MVLENNKWWVIDFCDFQYGELKEDTTNKAHQSYISLLKRHGLWKKYKGAYKGHTRGIYAPQEKDKDTDKDKKKDKEKEKKNYAEAVTMTPAQYEKLQQRFGNAATRRAIDKLSAYKLSKGKRYKSDYHAILQWVMEAVGGQETRAGPEWKCPKCGAVHHSTYKVCECGWGR